jgi:hypothetical protein
MPQLYLRWALWACLLLTSVITFGQPSPPAAPASGAATSATTSAASPEPVRLSFKLTKNAASDLVDSHVYTLTVDALKITSTTDIPTFTMQVDSTQTPSEIAAALLTKLRATAKNGSYQAAVTQSPEWKLLLMPGTKWVGRADNEKEESIEKKFLDFVESRLVEQAGKNKLKLGTATASSGNGTALKQSDLQLGVGLGWSIETSRSYSYSLLAPDYRIKAEEDKRIWPVISAVLCYNPKLYYIKRGDERKPAAQQRTELKAAQLAFLAAFNYNDVFSTAPNFNQHLGLGIGIGYSPHWFGDSRNIFLSAFLDGRLVRFLREGYEDGRPLSAFPTVTGTTTTPQVVTSLNINDDTYFVTHPVIGISLKAVFLFTGGAPKYNVTNTVP